MTYFEVPQPTITDMHRAATKDRLGGSTVAAIVRFFHSVDSRCVTCGMETWVDVMPADMTPGDKATFGHVEPASRIADYSTNGQRPGYTTDNGLLQCTDCNSGMGATAIVVTVVPIPSYFGAPKFGKLGKPAVTVNRADVKRSVRAAAGYAA